MEVGPREMVKQHAQQQQGNRPQYAATQGTIPAQNQHDGIVKRHVRREILWVYSPVVESHQAAKGQKGNRSNDVKGEYCETVSGTDTP
jgi:hypothetical protein